MPVATTLIRSLAPVALLVVGVSLLALWLLLDGSPVGPWLLAFLLVAHGWVHLLFLFPKPPVDPAKPASQVYPFDFGQSWLIGRAELDGRLVSGLGVGLTLAILLLHTLAALATVAFLVPTEWWPALVVAAALVSMLFLALFWSPLLMLGIVIDLCMLGLVVSGAWRPVG